MAIYTVQHITKETPITNIIEMSLTTNNSRGTRSTVTGESFLNLPYFFNSCISCVNKNADTESVKSWIC